MNYRIFYVGAIFTAILLTGCVKSAEERQVTDVNKETVLRIEGFVRPAEETKVMAPIDGEILYVLKRNGDTIHKGETIATYDKRPILIEIEKIQEKIRSKQRSMRVNTKSGGGAEHEAVLDNAKLQLQKIAQLYYAGAASKIEFDNAEDRYLTLLVNDDERRLVEAGRNKVYEEDKGVLQDYYAELAQLRYKLTRTNIIAMGDGFLTKFNLEEGQRLGTNDELGEIVNIENVVVYGALAPGLYQFVKVGQKVKLSFLTTPSVERSGVVERIVPVVDPEIGRMIIQIPLKNPDYFLQPSTKTLIEITLNRKDQEKVRKIFYGSDERSKFVDSKSRIDGDYSKYQKY